MVVEISRFKLVAGTDEAAFLSAAEETQAGFLDKQPGFHSRELLRGDDGWWMDIVRFESMDAAQAAFGGFAGHASAQAFERMLDLASIEMTHWSQRRDW